MGLCVEKQINEGTLNIKYETSYQAGKSSEVWSIKEF